MQASVRGHACIRVHGRTATSEKPPPESDRAGLFFFEKNDDSAHADKPRRRPKAPLKARPAPRPLRCRPRAARGRSPSAVRRRRAPKGALQKKIGGSGQAYSASPKAFVVPPTLVTFFWVFTYIGACRRADHRGPSSMREAHKRRARPRDRSAGRPLRFDPTPLGEPPRAPRRPQGTAKDAATPRHR